MLAVVPLSSQPVSRLYRHDIISAGYVSDMSSLTDLHVLLAVLCWLLSFVFYSSREIVRGCDQLPAPSTHPQFQILNPSSKWQPPVLNASPQFQMPAPSSKWQPPVIVGQSLIPNLAPSINLPVPI